MNAGVVHVHLCVHDFLGGQWTTLGIQASSAICVFFVCVYMHVIPNYMVYMLRSEGNLQVVRHGSKHLYPHNHFATPLFFFFFLVDIVSH